MRTLSSDEVRLEAQARLATLLGGSRLRAPGWWSEVQDAAAMAITGLMPGVTCPPNARFPISDL